MLEYVVVFLRSEGSESNLNRQRKTGIGDATPLKVFLRLFQEHLLLAHAVFSSCSCINEAHFGEVWRQSVAMETIYDVIHSMRASHF